jgi:4-hydroxythreonine-4-phosphate dehydrogenase
VKTARGPRLAITLGDPRGIGPEIVLDALRRLDGSAACEWLLVGPTGTVADALGLECMSIGHANGVLSESEAGRMAGRAIESAARLALDGVVDAIVTAPIDKAALNAGGFHFPGHTEMLAALAGGMPVSMMMAAERTSLGGPLRVVLATTHIPLAHVPAAVTVDLLLEQARITHHALMVGWQIESPRLALCALNPHASDGGLFGDEEARTLEPAVEAIRSAGIDVQGPIPADTVFLRSIRGEFDAVLAPYHDVGMAAFKTAAFGQGVNVTLGLPFVRTSPDHGTALDIAGKGMADASSMIEAIELALRLVSHWPQLRSA